MVDTSLQQISKSAAITGIGVASATVPNPNVHNLINCEKLLPACSKHYVTKYKLVGNSVSELSYMIEMEASESDKLYNVCHALENHPGSRIPN